MPHLHRRLSLRTSFFIAVLVALIVLGASILPSPDVQVLGVSAARPLAHPAAPARATGCVYYVRPGDNLFRIGLRYGVSYQYLASLNGIPNPHLIYAGSALSVPCAGNPGSSAIPPNCPASASYTVQAGDNLFRIALNHGSTVEWIRAANNLYGRVLRPNMQLTIPCPGTVPYRQVPLPGTEEPGTTPTAVPVQPPPTTPQTPSTSAQIIQMQGGQFNPNNVQVKLGTTVIWINNDTVPHTVTSGQPGAPDGRFDSGPIPPNGRFQLQASAGGIYAYFSKSDETMTGTVAVSP